jgi:hypothetical protein
MFVADSFDPRPLQLRHKRDPMMDPSDQPGFAYDAYRGGINSLHPFAY